MRVKLELDVKVLQEQVKLLKKNCTDMAQKSKEEVCAQFADSNFFLNVPLYPD